MYLRQKGEIEKKKKKEFVTHFVENKKEDISIGISADASVSTREVNKNTESAIPIGLFDDLEREMKMRNGKVDQKEVIFEIRAKEREVAEKLRKVQEQTEEFEKMLIPIREQEEDDIQQFEFLSIINVSREYIERFEDAKRQGAAVKRKLEEIKELRRTKRVKNVVSEAVSVVFDWKSKSV